MDRLKTSLRASGAAVVALVALFAFAPVSPAAAASPEQIGTSWGGSCWDAVKKDDPRHFGSVKKGTACGADDACDACCRAKMDRCQRKYGKFDKCTKSGLTCEGQVKTLGGIAGVFINQQTFEVKPVETEKAKPPRVNQPANDSQLMFLQTPTQRKPARAR